jgi:hypothetical protein
VFYDEEGNAYAFDAATGQSFYLDPGLYPPVDPSEMPMEGYGDPMHAYTYIEKIPLFLRCKAWAEQTEYYYQ